MTYNAEQITFMLAEVIDENREYKSWHVNTQHLMALVERVVAEEREACAKLEIELILSPAFFATMGEYDAHKDAVLAYRNLIRARGQA
jgi:hypothetical protein